MFYDTQIMGVFAIVLAENARGVQGVDLNVTGGMYDLVMTADDADVDNGSFFILEKGEVANAGFVNEVHWTAQFHLLGGVAG